MLSNWRVKHLRRLNYIICVFPDSDIKVMLHVKDQHAAKNASLCMIRKIDSFP